MSPLFAARAHLEFRWPRSQLISGSTPVALSMRFCPYYKTVSRELEGDGRGSLSPGLFEFADPVSSFRYCFLGSIQQPSFSAPLWEASQELGGLRNIYAPPWHYPPDVPSAPVTLSTLYHRPHPRAMSATHVSAEEMASV